MYYKKFREWVNEIIPSNRVIIFGYGNLGKALSRMLDDIGCEVLFFIDDYRSDEWCHLFVDAPILNEKVILAIDANDKSLVKKLTDKCHQKGYADVSIIEPFMMHIIIQTYMVPPIEQKHYIEDALPYFEPNCFKEFLLSGYPYNAMNKTEEMLEKGYPYDLNAKFQTLTKLENLYFYNDVRIEKNDIVVDGGVSYGWEQQISNFARLSNNEVHGFEPNLHSYQNVCKETKEITNIKLHNQGLADQPGIHYFVENGGGSMIVEYETDVRIETVKLDDVLDHVDFIKMDIEGYELEALKGAKKLIQKCKPKLAICLYHKPQDIYEIPKFIKELEPNYKLWIVCNEGFLWSGIKMFGIYER
jgi:FkbM family methyltransferase